MNMHKPLREAGEYVCDCLADGKEVSPKFGYGVAHERVVRCRDCANYWERHGCCVKFGGRWRDEYARVEPDGFCKWGVRKGER